MLLRILLLAIGLVCTLSAIIFFSFDNRMQLECKHDSDGDFCRVLSPPPFYTERNRFSLSEIEGVEFEEKGAYTRIVTVRTNMKDYPFSFFPHNDLTTQQQFDEFQRFLDNPQQEAVVYKLAYLELDYTFVLFACLAIVFLWLGFKLPKLQGA